MAVLEMELMRRMGVRYNTAWMLKLKFMQMMLERDALTTLTDRVEIDYAYIGGVRTGGNVGLGVSTKRLLLLPYKPTGKANQSAWCCTRSGFQQ